MRLPDCRTRKEIPSYPIEKSKIERLETICSRFGRRCAWFCMSEFYKSGALLSCLILHIKQLTDATRDVTQTIAMRRAPGDNQRLEKKHAVSLEPSQTAAKAVFRVFDVLVEDLFPVFGAGAVTFNGIAHAFQALHLRLQSWVSDKSAILRRPSLTLCHPRKYPAQSFKTSAWTPDRILGRTLSCLSRRVE